MTEDSPHITYVERTEEYIVWDESQAYEIGRTVNPEDAHLLLDLYAKSYLEGQVFTSEEGMWWNEISQIGRRRTDEERLQLKIESKAW